jgi:hypothetical protein
MPAAWLKTIEIEKTIFLPSARLVPVLSHPLEVERAIETWPVRRGWSWAAYSGVTHAIAENGTTRGVLFLSRTTT